MTIKLKKSNLKRLASLSALGAGALAANAGTAEAYIVYSGIVNQKVGFGSGYGTHASIALPNGAGLAFRVFRSTFPNTPGTILFLDVIAQNLGGPNGTGASFGVVNTDYTTLALAAPLGAKFGTPPLVKGYGLVAESTGGHTAGPEVTLVSWAYETSGAQLPAGVHGKALDGSDDIGAIVPSAFDAAEPATLASTGLPALALGAVGVRNWRAARNTGVGQ